MPSYTTSLRLIQPATGEYSGSWGTQVNNGITALVDTSVAGTASITMTTADYTLSTANGATDEARAMFLVLGGTPGAARNVICPAVSKLYYVTNNTTGGFAQTVKTASGSGISVPNGASMVLRCDGTNVVEAQNALGSIVLNGGTANGVAYLNASKALTTGSALTFDGTSFSINTALGTSTTAFTIQNSTGFSASNIARMDFRVNNSFGGNERVAAIWGMNPNASANNGGALVFGTSADGTATTPTERARITSGGDVGIGTAAPTFVSGGGVAIYRVGDARLTLKNNTTGDGSGTGAGLVYSGVDLTVNNQEAGYIRFTTTATERARITSGGELGLGTTSPRGNLDVGTPTATAITKSIHLGYSSLDYYGFRIANTNTASVTYAGTLAFQRGNGSAWVDVAIITDGGEFLVGASTVNGVGTTLLSSTPSRITQNNNGASSGFVFTSYQRSSTEIGSITQDGTTAVLYNTTSDRRLKDNIVPAPSASAVIDAIEIVSHDWKAAPDEHVTYGVIAQDLALVAPQAVLQGDDGDEIEKTWGVDYSKLVPMLIKEIQSLRARVAALEQA